METIFDCLLAASILSWGWFAVSSPFEAPGLVRAPIALLHLAAGLHVLVRSRTRKRAPLSSTLLSLPAVAVSGLALLFGAPAERWTGPALAVFWCGTLLAIYAFTSLGASFGVLPALRAIATEGPYRYLRHPAYAGELLMILGCSLSRPGPASIAVASLALPLLALRIRCEEALLLHCAEYRRYMERVRFRLLPGLW